MKSTIIDKFTAKGVSGRVYTILIYQDWIKASSHDEPDGEIPGMKRIVTSDGGKVNSIDADTFKIVQTDEIIRKI